MKPVIEVNEIDSANALADGAVVISKPVEIEEPSKAKGRYLFEHWGPQEHEREGYCLVRDQITALEAQEYVAMKPARQCEIFHLLKGMTESKYRILRAVKAAFNGVLIKALRAELNQIVLEHQQVIKSNETAKTYWKARLDAFVLEKKSPDDFILLKDNVVVTVGKNLALDTYLAGSAYTVVGPYMGLIGAVSYGAGPLVGDTMASHAGWTEAGTTNAPTYTSPRKTCAWSAASAGSKALSSALVYSITGSGTAKGAFTVYGSGALSTIDNTAGTMYSAGLFTGGDKIVSNGDSLSVSYSTSL